MKVYTKTGDSGQTSLIGGKRVKKNHIRVEAYGTVDELMAHIALLMDMMADKNDKDFLIWILNKLVIISSILAVEGETSKKIPTITATDVELIENQIDNVQKDLEPVNNFILPGGNITASQTHVARTVCRRAERRICDLIDFGCVVPVEVSTLINRLSDYLFVLSRKNICAKNE
jgi:cob(I)alamin adenosyltransferase